MGYRGNVGRASMVVNRWGGRRPRVVGSLAFLLMSVDTPLFDPIYDDTLEIEFVLLDGGDAVLR